MSEQDTKFIHGQDINAKDLWKEGWQAATAEAKKRISVLEKDVKYFKRVCETLEANTDKIIDEQKAHINTLREALGKWQKLCLDTGRASTELAIPSKALSATQAE